MRVSTCPAGDTQANRRSTMERYMRTHTHKRATYIYIHVNIHKEDDD